MDLPNENSANLQEKGHSDKIFLSYLCRNLQLSQWLQIKLPLKA